MNKRKLLLAGILLVGSFLLRGFFLNSFPPGLYTDEAAVGYSAYSVMMTGEDEFGNSLPLAFKSFNDYKAPVYIYSVIPFLVIYGVNEVGIRMSSALFSSLSVVALFLLGFEVFRKRKDREKLSFIVAVIFSLVPSHLTFSRIGFEGNLSLFFVIVGVYLFYLAKRKIKLLTLSLVSFSLSIYSYHSARLFTPLFVLVLFYLYRDWLINNWKKVARSILIAFLFSIPLLVVTFINFDELVRRPANISIFNDGGVDGKIWESQVVNSGLPVFFVRGFYNKPHLYLMSFLRNYFSHFSGEYLFVNGDMGEHFRVPYVGMFYIAMLPFLIIGIIELLKGREKYKWVLLAWLLLSPVAAGLTFMVPSGHRNLNMIVPVCVICGLGVVKFVNSKKRVFFVSLLFLANVLYFGYHYVYSVPMMMARDWNWGYKEAVSYIKDVEEDYKKVVLSDISGESYMQFLFYYKYDPRMFRSQVVDFDQVDKFGIGHIYKIGKYEFRQIDWENEEMKKGVLWVFAGDNKPEDDERINYLKEIYYPNGEVAFYIGEVKDELGSEDNFKVVYGWGSCDQMGERRIIIIGQDGAVTLQEKEDEKLVKEQKRKLDKEKLRRLRGSFDPAVFGRRKDVLVTSEDRFCSNLTIHEGKKEYQLYMGEKSYFMVDKLLVYLGEIWRDEY